MVIFFANLGPLYQFNVGLMYKSVPDMTYNVFGRILNIALSIHYTSLMLVHCTSWISSKVYSTLHPSFYKLLTIFSFEFLIIL